MEDERNRHDNSSKSKHISSLAKDANQQRCFTSVLDHMNNNDYEAMTMCNAYTIDTPSFCFVFLPFGFEAKMFCNELSVRF